jgi:hypothetical protein
MTGAPTIHDPAGDFTLRKNVRYRVVEEGGHLVVRPLHCTPKRGCYVAHRKKETT